MSGQATKRVRRPRPVERFGVRAKAFAIEGCREHSRPTGGEPWSPARSGCVKLMAGHQPARLGHLADRIAVAATTTGIVKSTVSSLTHCLQSILKRLIDTDGCRCASARCIALTQPCPAENAPRDHAWRARFNCGNFTSRLGKVSSSGRGAGYGMSSTSDGSQVSFVRSFVLLPYHDSAICRVMRYSKNCDVGSATGLPSTCDFLTII